MYLQELRGPYDVINLGMLFDLNTERARAAVTNVAKDIVARGDTRANTHKGIVRVEVIDEPALDKEGMEAES